MHYLLPIASANSHGFNEIPDTLSGGGTSLISFMQEIGNYLFAFFMVLAVIFLILAAFKYLTSGGSVGKKDSPAEVQKAHKMLIYAIIAVAVAVLAPVIINVIANFVSSSAR